MTYPWHQLQQHLAVSHETIERLTIYADLLCKWQPKINLVSQSTMSDVVNRHFLDSLQLLPLLPATIKRLVDMGSGAGFPGLVLAIAGVSDVHLIESDQRKAAFLKEIARLTSTPITIIEGRAEQQKLDGVDVITARGCADLSQLFKWSQKFCTNETVCLFHKGRNYTTEITEAKKEWLFHVKPHSSLSDPQASILECSKVEPR